MICMKMMIAGCENESVIAKKMRKTNLLNPDEADAYVVVGEGRV